MPLIFFGKKLMPYIRFDKTSQKIIQKTYPVDTESERNSESENT